MNQNKEDKQQLTCKKEQPHLVQCLPVHYNQGSNAPGGKNKTENAG